LELSAHVLNVNGMGMALVQQLVQTTRNSRYAGMGADRSIAAISREVKAATSEMNNKWYALPESSPLLGMSLEETDLRRWTGATLVAIRRVGGVEIDYPGNDETLEQGDRVLVVGSDSELVAFNELIKGEAAVPEAGDACLWVLIGVDSPIRGQKLAQLPQQVAVDVGVQALRRDGKFQRSPLPETVIEVGDRLLLCGGVESLNQASDWINLGDEENAEAIAA
jgi:monovalent cation:H+ antiporter-2, CPA2 family